MPLMGRRIWRASRDLSPSALLTAAGARVLQERNHHPALAQKIGVEILKDPFGKHVRHLCRAMGVLCIDVNVGRGQLEELRELCALLTEALVEKQSIKSVLKLCRRLDSLLQPDNEVNEDKDVTIEAATEHDQRNSSPEMVIGSPYIQCRVLRSGKKIRLSGAATLESD
uniref:Uncharacterized protein n=1 Tax=Trichuris muris TaxID=70415 RepID=A0A5S6QRX6_TRIMR